MARSKPTRSPLSPFRWVMVALVFLPAAAVGVLISLRGSHTGNRLLGVLLVAVVVCFSALIFAADGRRRRPTP
jgi:hypothetical protein